MQAEELIRMIHEQAHPMLEGLFGELRTNLGTSHYHRLSNEEFFRRGNAVLLRLTEWLTSRNVAAVHHSSEELGRERFTEGIPLGQVVLALILVEKQIWEYARQAGKHPDESLRLIVAEFFARLIYSAALGYEEVLAESQRKSRGTIVPPNATGGKTKTANSSEENQEISTSRSGQVGEFGG